MYFARVQFIVVVQVQCKLQHYWPYCSPLEIHPQRIVKIITDLSWTRDVWMLHITNDSLRHVIVSMWHNGFKWNARGNCRRSYACTGVSGISRVSTTCVSATLRLLVFDIAFLFVRSPPCIYIELLPDFSCIFVYNVSLAYLELLLILPSTSLYKILLYGSNI